MARCGGIYPCSHDILLPSLWDAPVERGLPRPHGLTALSHSVTLSHLHFLLEAHITPIDEELSSDLCSVVSPAPGIP
jgi:hypothetical protein